MRLEGVFDTTKWCMCNGGIMQKGERYNTHFASYQLQKKAWYTERKNTKGLAQQECIGDSGTWTSKTDIADVAENTKPVLCTIHKKIADTKIVFCKKAQLQFFEGQKLKRVKQHKLHKEQLPKKVYTKILPHAIPVKDFKTETFIVLKFVKLFMCEK